ncbi:hypothetical protein KAM380_094260 [Aeromonas caviae]|uniref:Uncharacterized protein n=1 Tax=Pseudomonas taiwanensis SJ9 TaxID=1388762 RepID=V7D5B1_9PSED|nr:hypothetical protein O164_28310 [Pseudomonas taiwanensis SJ9]GJB84961.1 hypothetical protein KAM380_094260 [Aeromonas caviae]
MEAGCKTRINELSSLDQSLAQSWEKRHCDDRSSLSEFKDDMKNGIGVPHDFYQM